MNTVRRTRSPTRRDDSFPSWRLLPALDGRTDRTNVVAFSASPPTESLSASVHSALPNTSHAARCVARHGVGSQPVPAALVGECSIPVV
jgi:hypothetical protein